MATRGSYQLSVRVSDDVLDRLKAAAVADRRSLADFSRILLLDALDEHERRHAAPEASKTTKTRKAN